MVTRILESRRSVAPVLDYNEQKVWGGNAVLLAARNVRSDSPYAISSAMMRLENNPAVSARARKLAFHMTVGPGVDDPRLDDAQILSYIDDVMARLGYGAQPYAVYRHNDIDREHYHVVSVNADERGHMIDRGNNAPRLMKIQRELSKKYGFHVGRADNLLATAMKPVRIRAGMKNMIAVMRADFEDAASWRMSSPGMLNAALSAWGLEAKGVLRPDGTTCVVMRGVDAGGNPVGRYLTTRRILGVDAADYLTTRPVPRRDEDGDGRVAEGLRKALAESASIEALRASLERMHLHLYLTWAAGRRTRRSENIADAMVADRKGRRVYSFRELGVDYRRLQELPLKEKKDRAEKRVTAEKPKRSRGAGKIRR